MSYFNDKSSLMRLCSSIVFEYSLLILFWVEELLDMIDLHIDATDAIDVAFMEC